MRGVPVTPNNRQGYLAYIPTWAAVKKWVPNIWTYILAQKKVRSSRQKSGAPMHLLIFYGFLALTIGTTLLAINTYSEELFGFKFHKGLYYIVYEITLDTFGLLFIAGCVWALGRRFLENQKSGRRALSHQVKDYWALALLLIVASTGFLLEGARIASHPQQVTWWDGISYVGYAIAKILGPVSSTEYRFIWWFHMVWIWAFFATLPQMKLKHIVLAIASSAGKPDSPMGRLTPISMAVVEATGKIGVTEPTDYNRWQLMSLDACMECGRCTEVCPAWGVGKALNPKEIVQGIRGALTQGVVNVAEPLTEEALWQCTTCNACVEACPVLIDQVDLIVDARRGLVTEGKLTGSAATMLRQTAGSGHAWGASSDTREDWMKDLDISLVRDGKPFDVLLWVGCAGATDPSAVKTTKALAKLLHKAGINFACLGREETCTGDAARRMGDEFLFQEKTQTNIETFNRYGVKKIVTPCPHCFNTLKNEYPDFDGHYDVQHHSQYLADLVDEGKLKPYQSDNVTFHDPCYLGRINNEEQAPRKLLGNDIREPEHFGRKTLCCGAGGGRMWMDESPDERPAVRRMQELADTGATTIGLGCPFCKIMLQTGMNPAQESELKLLDLAELLQEANRE